MNFPLIKFENDVITWRVRNFEWEPQVVGGGKSYRYMPKIKFGNRRVSSINSEHTNKYTVEPR